MRHLPLVISLVVALLTLAGGSIALELGSGTVILRVRNGAAPVSSAQVTAGELSTRTSVQGEARLDLPAGAREITVLHAGFAPDTLSVLVPVGSEVVTIVQLREVAYEIEVNVVAATRSGTIIEDQPIRVEAVPAEEIEENLTIAPGDISTLLNELGGLRVQPTAPALGGAELRLQGLRGRYTQVLSDELPLYGGVPDAFSLLQVPPLDLAQVEVIKGTASALYGGSALGGVVNLVSRRPGDESELLLNQTSRHGTDAVGFASAKLGAEWGGTLLGSLDRQSAEDLDADGWADLAGYRRAILRPRLFWDDQAGRSIFATAGMMTEQREGGTVGSAATPAGEPFRVTLGTNRFDGGVVGRFLLGGEVQLSAHASLARTLRDHRFGVAREHDARDSGLGELNLSGSARGHTWVVGGAVMRESLRARDLGRLDYTYTVPALFAQDEAALSEKFSVAASGRLEFHNIYGAQFNPRLSFLMRPEEGLSVRLSAGTGYAAPTPFNERTEAVGLAELLPLRGLQPERAQSASIDVGWSVGALELNGTVFASIVRHALMARRSPTEPLWLEIINAAGPTRTQGTASIARYSRGPLHVIGTHTFMMATESQPLGAGRREVPLTPRHMAELAAILENEAWGRIGVELSYTGRQSLEDNPYRSEGAAYVEISLLGEARIGDVRVFLNAENLTDLRQTRFDPLLLPTRAADGSWTTDAWAPLEGRVFNLGVRLEF